MSNQWCRINWNKEITLNIIQQSNIKYAIKCHGYKLFILWFFFFHNHPHQSHKHINKIFKRSPLQYREKISIYIFLFLYIFIYFWWLLIKEGTFKYINAFCGGVNRAVILEPTKSLMLKPPLYWKIMNIISFANYQKLP